VQNVYYCPVEQFTGLRALLPVPWWMRQALFHYVNVLAAQFCTWAVLLLFLLCLELLGGVGYGACVLVRCYCSFYLRVFYIPGWRGRFLLLYSPYLPRWVGVQHCLLLNELCRFIPCHRRYQTWPMVRTVPGDFLQPGALFCLPFAGGCRFIRFCSVTHSFRFCLFGGRCSLQNDTAFGVLRGDLIRGLIHYRRL